MTLDEAIEILEAFLNRLGGVWFAKLINAIKLGIEALRAIRDIRQKHPTHTITLLPGETKD